MNTQPTKDVPLSSNIRYLLKKGAQLYGTLFSVVAVLLLTVGTTYAQNCNTLTYTNSDNYSVAATSGTTGLTVPIISGLANVTSASTTDYATISGGALGATRYINVKYGTTAVPVSYPANTFAGFEIRQDAGLLGLNLLSGLTIQLLNAAGTVVESKNGNAALVGISLLQTANNTQILGFSSTVSFSQVRIIYSTGIVSLGSIRVYGAVIKKMCENPAGLACNTNENLVNPAFPVNIDMENTGVTGVANALGAVANPENVIDASSTNYATITGVAVGATSSLTVKKELSKFSADSTFVGFDIQSSGLATLSALSGMTISVMKDGLTVQTINSSQLLSLNSSLLTGSARNTIGFIPNVEFDAIKLSVNSTLSVSLGELRIYGVVVKHFCPATALTCNNSSAATNPDYPVFINAARMNQTGLISVGASISNTENIIDNNPSNFASINLTAGVGNEATVSVKDALTAYPAGTFTGFDIKNNQSLLSADLLGGIVISTYRNDTLQEQFTGNNLLVGASTSLLSGTNRSKVGFLTTKSFDEVVMTLKNTLVTANLGTTDVYGAIFETFCPGVITCNNTFWLTEPNYPVIINQKNTGSGGVIGVGSVANAWSLITPDTSDFATIDLNVGVVASASISVLDVKSTYPIGTVAGFAVKDPSNLAEVALFQDITITTYNNGVLQETKSSTDLLNLSVLTTLIGPNTGVHNVGFMATKAFNEVQITYSGVASVLKTLDVYGAFVDTRYVNSGVLLCGIGSNPDVAITNINVPVDGNVSTNDDTPPNTNYSFTGTPNIPSGSTPIFSIDSAGVYTFVTDVPGVYTYDISICTEGITTPCPTEKLTITVMDPDSVNNPVANLDIANGIEGNSIVIPSLDNDRAGTNGAPLNPASVIIVTAPTHGTTSINTTTGAITYTPAVGFTGTDFLVYQVCDTNNNCATAEQRIHVEVATSANSTSASPDYYHAVQNSVITGNVSLNDIDPEGDTKTVVFLDTPTPAQGTLTFTPNGDFVFTPNPAFNGALQLRYRTCDDGTPTACAEETLNLLYDKTYPNLSPSLSFSPSTIIGVTNVNVVANVYNFGINSTTGLITVYIFKDSMMTLSFDQNATNLSGQILNNSNWTFDSTSDPSFYILTTNSTISVPLGIQKLGFTTTLDPNGTKGDLNLSIIVGSGSGGDRTNEDNINSTTLNYHP